MSGLKRAYVRDGDKTTAGGTVEAPYRGMIFDGKNVCFEGDKVWYPACKSYGITQCVPPYWPCTGPNGRQTNLEGDLCLCGCPTPPRLIASQHHRNMGFTQDGIAGMAGAEGWLAHAGHGSIPMSAKAFNDRFRLIDEETGEPFAHCEYVVRRADGQSEYGVTDALGHTHLVGNTDDAEGIRIDLGDWEDSNEL